MKSLLLLIRLLLPAAMAAAATAANAAMLAPDSPPLERRAMPVAANCSAVGQSVAASNGGQLLRATSADRGGQTVCVITYTVPGRDGKPPRRVEIVVNAN